MPHGARRVLGLAVTAAVAVSIVAGGLTSAAAEPSRCADIKGLKGHALSSCLHSLRHQARVAGREAAEANETYLQAKQQSDEARDEAEQLDTAATHAAVVAATSRARAAVVAAHLARTGGSVGQTTEVLLSGDGASEVLYHLSRMTELTEDTSTLAADAAADQRSADDLSQQAALAADRMAVQQQEAADAYAEARTTSNHARMLVAKAEEQQNPGSNAAYIQAYRDLPADASVVDTVLAYARAQIGKPYVFGAAGPGSFDCSGLTMSAFAATGRDIGGHGVNVQYRLAASQGLLVPFDAAQPGDLLFYGSGDFSHVAIYSGDGNMIEAPMPGRDVRETAIRPADLAPVVARFTG
ncbi:C40 family peptidase [uncultured Amnibacterium sp.]|uniref:C40 family peptidase n=1 Tax=uncultured Amnibacterium sp. TaxID=1631851 RepID=UPI0035CAD174